MTNLRQRQQIYRPLLDRNPDLVQLDKYWLCISPIRHMQLRVIIDRTSEADCCDPKWYIWSSFLNSTDLTGMGGFYWWVKRPLVWQERSWLWSAPAMIEELIGIIETETLPLLRKLDTLEAYAAFYRETFDRYWHAEWAPDRMLVDIALGDLDAARRIWEALPQSYHEGVRNSDGLYFRNRWTEIRNTIVGPLLADDRPALARILHEWEADNVRRAGYEPYWESTPFPLEAGLD
ncbi:MAG: hypothetical protein ABW179_07505 [Methylobacterium sp.]